MRAKNPRLLARVVTQIETVGGSALKAAWIPFWYELDHRCGFRMTCVSLMNLMAPGHAFPFEMPLKSLEHPPWQKG
jgi:hypothetical protein